MPKIAPSLHFHPTNPTNQYTSINTEVQVQIIKSYNTDNQDMYT